MTTNNSIQGILEQYHRPTVAREYLDADDFVNQVIAYEDMDNFDFDELRNAARAFYADCVAEHGN